MGRVLRRLLPLMVLAACGSPEAAGPDVAPPAEPGAAADAGHPDAAAADGGAANSGKDGEPADAAPDTGDAGAAPPLDGAHRDAAPRDAGRPDAVPPDATPPDAGPPREHHCFNGVDDDGDGRVDCADRDCRGTGACFEHPEDCFNGADDNGDDRVDCDDVLCLGEPACAVPPVVPPHDTATIQALFDAHCAPCHAGPENENQALLTLDPDFTASTVGVDSSQIRMLRIAPGDRQQSYLYHKLRYSHHSVRGGGTGMPPEQPLPAADVERIGRWIDALPR